VTATTGFIPPAEEPPFDPEIDAPPPHRGPYTVQDVAQDAERVFIATLITNPETAAKHLELIDPTDFYQPRHELIHDAIRAVTTEGLVPDHPTLLAHLLEAGTLQRAGGHQYLLALRDVAPVVPPDTNQLEHWAELIRDAAGLRKLDNQLISMRQRIAGTSTENVKNTLAELSDIADQVATNFGPTQGDKHGRLIHGDTFILDRPREIPAAWGTTEELLWAQGEALLIAGPAGVGKTTIAQQVMLAGIGIREDALNVPVRPFKRVLYIAADRPPQAARSLERMVTDDHRDQLREHLVFWKGPPDRDFAKHPDELTRMCELVHADAVIIDSLKDVALGLSDDEVGAGLNTCLQRALVNGIEVLALHHYRKRAQDHANREPKSLDELYGSTWITAGAGSVLSLWGAAGDPVVQLRHLKQPAEEFGPLDVTHDHDTGTSTITPKIDLLAQIRSRGTHGLTPTAAACLISKKDKPTRSDIEKARRQLDRLVTHELAIKQPSLLGGRGAEAAYLPAARRDQF
jgi:replicative DNA helicase